LKFTPIYCLAMAIVTSTAPMDGIITEFSVQGSLTQLMAATYIGNLQLVNKLECLFYGFVVKYSDLRMQQLKTYIFSYLLIF
jgi:predicted membrane protein